MTNTKVFVELSDSNIDNFSSFYQLITVTVYSILYTLGNSTAKIILRLPVHYHFMKFGKQRKYGLNMNSVKLKSVINVLRGRDLSGYLKMKVEF